MSNVYNRRRRHPTEPAYSAFIGPMTPSEPENVGKPAGILRRFAAILYDSLLLVAILFVAALPLPAIPEALRTALLGRLAVQLYLLAVGILFFAWFWVHGGQTLGMRAWRLKVVTDPGGAPLNWRNALTRALLALISWVCLGVGFLWALWDPQRRAWHDRGSRTRLIVLPKRPRRKRR